MKTPEFRRQSNNITDLTAPTIQAGDRIKEIFGQAMEMESPSEREQFLTAACAGDAELRRQVETLLQAHEQAGDFLRPTIQVTGSDLSLEPTGAMIGRYKILERIGEGGFGSVYMAEQTQPVQRKVALKIIKAGMDTREVVARFEAERQALALMEHPNIARVLDAGATQAGRPYFVMELVRGLPITTFCDQRNLCTRERLELFIKVCHAVQHAHQKGIIHRDIKPSNVLVTLHDGLPVPKVIDFGVAKALGQKLTEKTLFTGFAHMIGTPAYMSPEQAELSGLDMDTRADIYSLGVLLYELLTGATPFDMETLREAAFDEIRRMIRETEPPKPSTRLQTLGENINDVARRHNTEPATLSRAVRGDLDWITMRCLEKDRQRRYETANALTMDLQRHLKGEAVLARPPSAIYRFQTFARRNRVGLVTAMMVALSLIVGTVFSTVEALRANRSSREAERQALRAAKSASDEAQQRRRAEELAEQNRQHLYAARINLAQQIHHQGDAARVNALLESLRPSAGQTDLRGFEWYHLWRAGHSEAHNITGHTAPVRSVAYSGDGALLASAGGEDQIRLWDTATGRERRVLTGHNGWISSVAFSADGKLASGSADRTVRLWDSVSGELLSSFTGFTNEVTAIAFSGRGDLLAAASGVMATGQGNPLTRYVAAGRGGEVKIWNVATRQLAGEFQAQRQGVMSLGFARDGRTLVTGGTDRTIVVWDVSTGEKRGSVVASGPVFSLVFAPDGATLAVGAWWPYRAEAEIEFWDTKTWTRTARISQLAPVTCLAFGPDGGAVASGGIDRVVRVWDVAKGTERASFKGHTEGVWALDFAPDGRSLTSGSWDGTVKIWDLNRSHSTRTLGEACGYSVAFSPDSKWLASSGNDFVEIWDMASERSTRRLQLGGRVDDVVVAVSPDGKTVSAVGTDRVLSIFDTGSWTRQHALTGHKDKIWSVAYAPDSKTIATGSGDSTVKLWDAARGSERATLLGHSSTVRSLAFTPDGKILISGSYRELRFWDILTGKLLQAIEERAPLMALSPDGKLLASGAEAALGGIRVRDFASRRELARIEGHKDAIYHLAFSADGKTIATASWDGTAKLWRALGGELLMTIPSGLAVAWSVAFSADGQFFAVGSGSRSTGGRVVMLRAATTNEAAAPQPQVTLVSSPKTGKFPLPKSDLDTTIEARSPQAGPELIDLSAYYNGSLTRGWIPSSTYGTTEQRNLGELPRGVGEFAGTRFDVRGLVQLAGHSLNGTLMASYPAEVKGIRVGQKCRQLLFLHGTGWLGGEGQMIGRYVVHFAGGAREEVPIVYGGNVRDWWHLHDASDSTPDAVVAWTGKNDAVRAGSTVLKLYKSSWNNPHPDLVIESVDFISLNSMSSPFLIALTVEP